jgi:hypothetical protein
MRLDYIDPVFTTSEVVEFVDIPTETLQQWVKRGVIRFIQPNPGKGRRRLWSTADMFLVYVLRDLNRLNQPPALLKNGQLQNTILSAGKMLYDHLVMENDELSEHEVSSFHYLHSTHHVNSGSGLGFMTGKEPFMHNPFDEFTTLSVHLYGLMFRLVEFAHENKGLDRGPGQVEAIRRYNAKRREDIESAMSPQVLDDLIRANEIQVNLGYSEFTKEDIIALQKKHRDVLEKLIIQVDEDE